LIACPDKKTFQGLFVAPRESKQHAKYQKDELIPIANFGMMNRFLSKIHMI
jgi:hypothetical protein